MSVCFSNNSIQSPGLTLTTSRHSENACRMGLPGPSRGWGLPMLVPDQRVGGADSACPHPPSALSRQSGLPPPPAQQTPRPPPAVRAFQKQATRESRHREKLAEESMYIDDMRCRSTRHSIHEGPRPSEEDGADDGADGAPDAEARAEAKQRDLERGNSVVRFAAAPKTAAFDDAATPPSSAATPPSSPHFPQSPRSVEDLKDVTVDTLSSLDMAGLVEEATSLPDPDLASDAGTPSASGSPRSGAQLPPSAEPGSPKSPPQLQASAGAKTTGRSAATDLGDLADIEPLHSPPPR